jgi:hypothetical protein
VAATTLASRLEENLADSRSLESRGFLTIRPDEGSPIMGEQFALDQIFGQDTAVDPDERIYGTVGMAVRGGGDHFLAGPALSGDQDCYVRIGKTVRSLAMAEPCQL